MNSFRDIHSPNTGRSMKTGVAVLVLLAAGLGGCATLQKVSKSISEAFGAHPPKVTTTPPPAPAGASTVAPPPVVAPKAPPLKTIIAEQLEKGHYTVGRRQLGLFLRQHPNDRAAKDMWRQLTVNPDTLLGSRSRIHVVRPGETYASLAARYLGDASRFLVLARYNGAADPSVLQVGQRIRIPASAPAGEARPTVQGAVSNPQDSAARAAPPASVEQQALRLQKQGVALLGQGHRKQALDRMTRALDLDPHLKPSGPDAEALRSQVVATFHQRAIVLYRDQKLSQAIALWNRVLAIDPQYEPAIIYRARARELQSRLKQL